MAKATERENPVAIGTDRKHGLCTEEAVIRFYERQRSLSADLALECVDHAKAFVVRYGEAPGSLGALVGFLANMRGVRVSAS